MVYDLCDAETTTFYGYNIHVDLINDSISDNFMGVLAVEIFIFCDDHSFPRHTSV